MPPIEDLEYVPAEFSTLLVHAESVAHEARRAADAAALRALAAGERCVEAKVRVEQLRDRNPRAWMPMRAPKSGVARSRRGRDQARS